MPSDIVMTLMITTGLGVSVIVGILSGVCYVVVQGIKTQRNRKLSPPSPQWYCAVCNRHLRSIEGVLETDRIAKCTKCNKKVCKKRCSKYIPLEKSWICQICRNEPAWLSSILSTLPNSKFLKFAFKMDQTQRIDEIDEDIEAIRKKEKEQVRDFIERLVAAMLGSNVDDASISRIYSDKEYDALFERYHEDLVNALIDLGSALHISIANLPVSGQSPCTAHTTLKQIIEKVLRETLNLPPLHPVEDHPAVPLDERERTYEDLLATAILNKVVNNNQNQSSNASVSSQRSSSSKYKNKEYYFGDETLESKYKNTDFDTTSVSSIEDWIHSDSSLGSTKYVDKVSLTIQQRIEEVSPSDDESDDSEYLKSNSSLLSADDSNWYLKKRHFQGTHSPVPVPMLVPNPTSEAKVLIGDKEVDETSDLSDAASDYGEIVPTPTLNTLLVESRTLIGGKNLLNGEIKDGEDSDTDLSSDSGVKKDSTELYEEEDRPKADITLDDENIEDISVLSVYSNTEKDTEYTEKYASLPRTITKSPVERIQQDNDVEDEDQEFTGHYSKKEKEKWKKPVEMKNNPYTKENIEKRIKNTEIFGRDYYLRQASLPSGTRKLGEINQSSFNNIEEETFRAVPTIIDDDSVSVQKSGDISEITSDSDLSLVNCYDVENSKIYRRSSDGEEKEIKVSVNTEGLLYNPKNSDEVDSIQQDSEVPYNNESNSVEESSPKFEIRVNTGLVYDPQLDENSNITTPKVAPRSIKTTPVPSARNKYINEDNTPKIIKRKSDNTLIKKIYSDLSVRSFALANREQLPVDDTTINAQKSPEIIASTPKIQRVISNGTPEPHEKTSFDLSNESISHFEKIEKARLPSDSDVLSDDFSLEFSDIEPHTPKSDMFKDPEITELKEKRLVASRLGEFSKSFPNLSRISPTSLEESNRSHKENGWLPPLSENETISISVKDLRKMFESNNSLSKSKPVHSLTARSISKPMREKLKSEDSSEELYIIDAIQDSPEVKIANGEMVNTVEAVGYYKPLQN